MKVKIGTRGSKLALTQTQLVADALSQAHPGMSVELVEITTQGDRKQGTALASKGDKRDWIHDLEVAVESGAIDLAVHSGKDVPEQYSAHTELVSVLPRANPFDIFIGKTKNSQRMRLEDLPQGAVVGTASLRRRAQLLKWRADLSVVEHRGNVPTRIDKLEASETLSGIVLAAAGVARLGLSEIKPQEISRSIMLPAINQGILTVQFLRSNSELRKQLAAIQHTATQSAFQAERGVVSLLKGDCDSAISIYAEADEREVYLRSRVLLPDGSKEVAAEGRGAAAEAWNLGQTVAKELIAKGAEELLAESRNFAEARKNARI